MAICENDQFMKNLSESCRAMSIYPPPISETDLKFFEARKSKSAGKKVDVMKRVNSTGNRLSLSSSMPNLDHLDEKEKRKISLRKAILEKKAEKDDQKNTEQSLKEKTLSETEKELWDSGDWRQQIKDLNSSFSKLPPIIKGNKVKGGKSRSYVVD